MVKENKIVSILICILLGAIILIENISFLNFLDSYYVKHILVLCGIVALFVYTKIECDKNNIPHSKVLSKEFKIITIMAIIFVLISLYKMSISGNFGIYLIKQIYFILTPILFVSLSCYCCKESLSKFVNVLFFVSLFCFVCNYILTGQLTIQGILSAFNIKNTLISSTTQIETNMAQYFFMCFFVFMCDKKYLKSLICFIFVILSAKRFSIIFLFLSLIFFILTSKNLKQKDKNYYVVSWILISVFVIATIAVYNIYNDVSFPITFKEKTGLDLTEFVMSRNKIFLLVYNSEVKYSGLGGVTQTLEMYNIEGMTNLHNDFLMLFMDCGLIGVIIFTVMFVKLFKHNKYSIFFGTFILTQLFSTHYLGSGGLIFFIFTYFIFEYLSERASIFCTIGSIFLSCF